MKRLLNWILSLSTLLIASLDPSPTAAKKVCPRLNRNIIQVLDDDAILRILPGNHAEKGPTIFKGDILAVSHTIDAKLVGKSCFYPVTINNSTYWIPENEIKRSNIVPRTSDFRRQTKPVQIPTKQSGTFSPQLLPFLALTTLFLIASVLVLAYLYVKINLSLNKLKESNQKFEKLAKALAEINYENRRIFYQIDELVNNIDSLPRQNTVHSEEMPQSESAQAHYSCPPIDKPLPVPPAITMPPPLFESNLPELHLIIPSEHSISSGLEQQNILNHFYSNVIDKFNNADHEWFRSRIQDGIFRNATITKSSIIEAINPIKVELSTNGTLLLYHVFDKVFLIPDPTQPSWTRTITSSLFINSGETFTLHRAVELTSDHIDSWLIVKRGEFKA